MSDNQTETPGTRYERNMVPALFEPFARDLVGRLHLNDGMRVADIGCGTGIVARLIGEILDTTSVVFGIDINAGMLDVARAKSKAIPCEFFWYEAPADALPLNDASLDLLVSQQAFMFFPDKSAAAREMHRVLGVGGGLYVSAWRHYSHQPHYAAMIEGLARLVGSRAAELMKGSLQFETEDQIRAPLVEGGFQKVQVETVKLNTRFPSADHFVRTIVSGSILARMGIEIDDDALKKLCSHVANALAEYEDASGLVVPTQSYLAYSVR